RLDRRTSTLIEPEIQPLVMNHAPDEATILPHGTIHGEPKPVHPEVQTLLQIGAGYDRNARFNDHLRFFSSRALFSSPMRYCRYTRPTVIGYLKETACCRALAMPGLLFDGPLALENAMPVRRVLSCMSVLFIFLATASGGLCYIHFPPKTLKEMCKQSHHIRLLKIDKASREKG